MDELTPELRLLALFIALSISVVILRRRYWSPDTPARQWFEAHIAPRAHQAIIAFFSVTLVVWLFIWATAPDDRRDDLGKEMKKLFPENETPAPVVKDGIVPPEIPTK